MFEYLFKTGDKVRCLDAEDTDELLVTGGLYEVRSVWGEHSVFLKNGDGKPNPAWSIGRFELVTPEELEANPQPLLPGPSELRPDAFDVDPWFESPEPEFFESWTSDRVTTYPVSPVGPWARQPNPKQAFGATKPELGLCPPVATLHQAMAHEDGARKYGAYNWRHDPVEAMTYIHAAKRHLDLYLDRQEFSSDSGVHNLGAVMACCAILLDSRELRILIDNRPPPGESEQVQHDLQQQKIGAAAAREAEKHEQVQR